MNVFKTGFSNSALTKLPFSFVKGIHVYLEDDTKLDEMRVEMTGPEDSPYAKGTFQLKVQIPDR